MTDGKQDDGEALAAAEERQSQRRSWAIGELMLQHPDMDRAEAERLVDTVAASLAERDS
jgi:hypothetical protein